MLTVKKTSHFYAVSVNSAQIKSYPLISQLYQEKIGEIPSGQNLKWIDNVQRLWIRKDVHLLEKWLEKKSIKIKYLIWKQKKIAGNHIIGVCELKYKTIKDNYYLCSPLLGKCLQTMANKKKLFSGKHFQVLSQKYLNQKHLISVCFYMVYEIHDLIYF